MEPASEASCPWEERAQGRQSTRVSIPRESVSPHLLINVLVIASVLAQGSVSEMQGGRLCRNLRAVRGTCDKVSIVLKHSWFGALDNGTGVVTMSSGRYVVEAGGT